MRTYSVVSVVLSIGLIGLAVGLPPAASFDGRPSDLPPGPALQSRERAVAPKMTVPGAAPAAMPRPPATIPHAATPIEALRSGTQALRAGKPDQAVTALEYAAEQGMPGARWKLGRMYADGDGVSQDKLRAFEHFRNLTKTHAYEPPDSPQSRFVASAFVALGHFYFEGIPGSVKADPAVAMDLFRHAASYFGDPDAQYQLGRLYLYGNGTAKDGVQAARWLRLAANKGQRDAQALLGSVLFKGGQGVSRQAAQGLFWLTVAKDGAGPEDAWITETYRSAFAQATVDERALAYRYLEDWLRYRRR